MAKGLLLSKSVRCGGIPSDGLAVGIDILFSLDSIASS